MSSEKYTPSEEDAAWVYVTGLGSRRHRPEFDRFVAKIKAEAWDEGASDGQWNLEHEGQIERGTRQPITNPYRENGDNNE